MSNRRTSWLILTDAQEAVGLMDMIEERAACNAMPQPHTPGDYLMWIKDEIIGKEEELKAAKYPEEVDQLLDYLKLLRGIVQELEELGIVASPEPWYASM